MTYKSSVVNQLEFVQDRQVDLGTDNSRAVILLRPHQGYTELIFFQSRTEFVCHALQLEMHFPPIGIVTQANFFGCSKELFESEVSLYQQLFLIQSIPPRRLNTN